MSDGSVSRLAKRRFFERFVALASTRFDWNSLIDIHARNNHLVYASLKQAAREFAEAKEKMQVCLQTAKYGKWCKKPIEQDEFEIPIIAHSVKEGSSSMQVDDQLKSFISTV